ncbi:MAG: helix-turn-helix transcriptional regulator [Allosphingosinicella sp.]
MGNQDPFNREARSLRSALAGLGVTARDSDPFATKNALAGLGGVTTLGSDPFATKNALGLGGASNAFAAPQTTHAPTRSLTPGAAAPRAAPSVSRQQQESATKLSRAADLGSIIRSARKALALNQQEFADLAGVGRRFVSELESGKPSLEFDKVLRCCAAAGIDILAAPRRLA